MRIFFFLLHLVLERRIQLPGCGTHLRLCAVGIYDSEKKKIQEYSRYSSLKFLFIIILCIRTDEEQLFGELLSSDEEKVAEYKQWEDFASVATNLLEWLDELLEGRFENVEN